MLYQPADIERILSDETGIENFHVLTRWIWKRLARAVYIGVGLVFHEHPRKVVFNDGGFDVSDLHISFGSRR